MIIVNSEKKSIACPILLAEFLKQENYPLLKIAVEKNGEIIPKSQYETCMINDGDHLEVVTFVGGG